ncbi:10562_t:CDS:2, partial [Diversispora eburnea]
MSSFTEDAILETNHDADSPNTVTRVVVIAIDQSNYSHYAFDWAVKNFLRKESDLVAIALQGDAREEIVRKVSELNADGLIIGSRGLGVIKR